MCNRMQLDLGGSGMTLREQLLSELRMQNESAMKEIRELEEKIKTEAFMMSTVTGGALSGAARSACQNRMQEASNRKAAVTAQNSWISEMLAKYH